MTFPVAVGTGIALCTAPGTAELLVLTVAGLLPARRLSAIDRAPLRLAVVVPAHNEELNIARCVASLYAADSAGIDLGVFVIADNCADATDHAAGKAGATVLVRRNAQERGKGYALDYAFQTLLPHHWNAFVVVDADSEVSQNFLQAAARAFRSGAQATQCRYIVRNSGESVRTRLMNLALYGFNVLRPRGRDRLGLSAGIYGNGFGLSAETLERVPYTAASVVEDLEYHLALVRAGRRVRFVDDAAVYGDMPAAGEGVNTQRARWEGGRLRMIAERALPLFCEILRGRFRLAEPCMDLLLLPLAFHVMFLMAAVLTPFSMARDLGIAGICVVALHLFAALRVGGGTLKAAGVLALAPLYVFWKILLIPRLFRASRAGAAWVRTERHEQEKLS